MNQNITTGTFEFTSNKDHVYIQGTEENDIELLSLKGNSELNKNSCTYDRFREGFRNQLFYYTGDYYSKYVKVFGTRFIYDSQGEAHENIVIKQNTVGGLYNIIPTTLKNQDSIEIVIKIHENNLESADTCRLQFINTYWDIKGLGPGIHTITVKMTVQNNAIWLLPSHTRPEFFNINIVNTTAKNKKLDFEILEIAIVDAEGITSRSDDFQSSDIKTLTVQEGSLDKISEYTLNGEFASRLNIINKKILKIQDMLF